MKLPVIEKKYILCWMDIHIGSYMTNQGDKSHKDNTPKSEVNVIARQEK